MTTLLSHINEENKATKPSAAELLTLRTNVAKQQQKVEQLWMPEASFSVSEVMFHTFYLQSVQTWHDALPEHPISVRSALCKCCVTAGSASVPPSYVSCQCCPSKAAGAASTAQKQDKALRKETGRLTKMQEDLDRMEARYAPQMTQGIASHTHSSMQNCQH